MFSKLVSKFSPWTRRGVLLAVLVFILTSVVAAQSETNKPRDTEPPREAAAPEKEALQIEIGQFFDRLTEQIKRGGRRAVLTSIASPYVYESLVERGLIRIDSEAGRQLASRQLRRSLARCWELWADELVWDSYEILQVQWIDSTRAIVSIRHRQTEWAANLKYDWWVVRLEPNTWRIYDFEDKDKSLRISTLAGLGLESFGVGEPWLPAAKQLTERLPDADSLSSSLWSIDDLDEVLDELLEHDLPDDLFGFAVTARASIALFVADDPELALNVLLKLEDKPDKFLGGRYLKGVALMALDRYHEAIDSFHEYGQHLGYDAEVYEDLSDCCLAVGERQQAVEYAEKGLVDDGRSVGCLASLAVALPQSRKGELLPHFERMSHDESAYEVVLDWAIDLEDWETAAVVFEWFTKMCPDSELLPYYKDLFIR